MQKKNKRNVFGDKRFTMVASLLLAVLAWVIVAGFITPRNTTRIERIPIDYTRGEGNYLNHDLKIVTEDRAMYADVEVSGPDTIIGTLDNTSVTVFPNYSQIREAGEFEVPLQYEKLTSGNYEITRVTVRGTSKSTLTLAFERTESKTMPVTVSADNVVAAEGYFKDEPVVSPGEVTINGPTTDLERVAQVAAVITDEDVRTTGKIYSAVSLVLLDEYGEEINAENFTFEPGNTVEVSIPILVEREIGLTVGFSGVPQGFDLDWFESLMTLTATNVRVAGAQTAFENLDDPYKAGILDLTAFSLTENYSPITLEFPEGIRNLDQLTQVGVSFDKSSLATRTISSSNITVVNGPSNAEVTPTNAVLPNITLIGQADQLEALLPENVTVEVDASSLTATANGQQPLPARIVIAGANRVFAVGPYTVLCNINVDT